MRFLIDAQLPPALARWLGTHGHEAAHVGDLGMQAASDIAIWEHARTTAAVIVIKDEDFAQRKVLFDKGPAIVWVGPIGLQPHGKPCLTVAIPMMRWSLSHGPRPSCYAEA